MAENITSESNETSYLSIDDIHIRSRFFPRVKVGNHEAESCIIVLIYIDGTDIKDSDFNAGQGNFLTIESINGTNVYKVADYCTTKSGDPYKYCLAIPSIGASRGYIGTQLSNKSIPGFAQIAYIG